VHIMKNSAGFSLGYKGQPEPPEHDRAHDADEKAAHRARQNQNGEVVAHLRGGGQEGGGKKLRQIVRNAAHDAYFDEGQLFHEQEHNKDGKQAAQQ